MRDLLETNGGLTLAMIGGAVLTCMASGSIVPLIAIGVGIAAAVHILKSIRSK